MPTLDVIDKKGQQTGKIELSDEVFGAEVKEHLLWEIVRGQLASRRRGCGSAKGRSDVRGGGAKPYRQKGTGRARQGSRSAPNHVGGGVVFPPKPRSFKKNLTKKAKKSALRSALSLRVSENKLFVVDDLSLPEIKTKGVKEILEGIDAQAALIVENDANKKLMLSARNLSEHKFLSDKALNVYDILRYKTLVITEKSVKALDERLRPVKKAEAESMS
jgi:large subunit ribosomal protein L4